MGAGPLVTSCSDSPVYNFFKVLQAQQSAHIKVGWHSHRGTEGLRQCYRPQLPCGDTRPCCPHPSPSLPRPLLLTLLWVLGPLTASARAPGVSSASLLHRLLSLSRMKLDMALRPEPRGNHVAWPTAPSGPSPLVSIHHASHSECLGLLFLLSFV